ncbi:DNA adenine methylase [Pedobacter sp. MC2016-24]|uniref:DNA adenine methylase n=1 Tax=Pedobacter sp. MC2016-24 TaxID=2780090 RepID=UPI001883095A|nr:DNA adenine methylase [Pedobacter sp. MC2016-24]MBE9602663.1 DNA adenine methylase [Pedobacter sp. MC2016-24]
MINSPLRYPGGKNKLSAFFARLCIENKIDDHYVEPYSGGASVALFLLMENIVKKITINDKDRSIYAFWYSVLNHTESFCKLILETDITVENWELQKLIQAEKETCDLLDLGFSTFFLNRTNRSGIINGGMIGGKDQHGAYKIDCRFNKNDLITRIRAIANLKDRINLYQMDAIALIEKIESENGQDNTIFYFDPPYYLKANSLYMNHYKMINHIEVSERIKAIKNIKWVVSYDNVPEIQALYNECKKKEYSFKHTAGIAKVGNELLYFSSTLKEPQIVDWNPLKFKVIRDKTSKRLKRVNYLGNREQSLSFQTAMSF